MARDLGKRQYQIMETSIYIRRPLRFLIRQATNLNPALSALRRAWTSSFSSVPHLPTYRRYWNPCPLSEPDQCIHRPIHPQSVLNLRSTLVSCRISSSSCCRPPPPPPVAHAWPVHDNRDGNVTDNEKLLEVAPTSTTPPASPGRCTLPVCSPVAHRSEVRRRESAISRRVIPRLAGLAEYAMRAFLTE